jgi:hypothetical protein
VDITLGVGFGVGVIILGVGSGVGVITLGVGSGVGVITFKVGSGVGALSVLSSFVECDSLFTHPDAIAEIIINTNSDIKTSLNLW